MWAWALWCQLDHYIFVPLCQLGHCSSSVAIGSLFLVPPYQLSCCFLFHNANWVTVPPQWQLGHGICCSMEIRSLVFSWYISFSSISWILTPRAIDIGARMGWRVVLIETGKSAHLWLHTPLMLVGLVRECIMNWGRVWLAFGSAFSSNARKLGKCTRRT